MRSEDISHHFVRTTLGPQLSLSVKATTHQTVSYFYLSITRALVSLFELLSLEKFLDNMYSVLNVTLTQLFKRIGKSVSCSRTIYSFSLTKNFA